MDVNKNATIKLFGKRIPLSLQAGGDDEKFQNRDEDEHEHEQKEEHRPKLKNQDQETPDSQERCEATTSESDNRKPPLIEQESSTSEEQGGGTSDPTEKTTAKKPDKILLCPRCKSMDTKFCYYNNYNVNQPRHFCKNCQRYWTAGGTMRNVPVGAGRRKNKNSCPYLQIAIPKSAVQALQPDETVLRYHPCSAPSGAVLSFGSSAPPGKTKKNSPGSDGFHQAPPSPVPRAMNTGRETSAPFPCFNGSTWPPYPWNQPLPLCAASIPVPVYPAAYWSGATPPATWCIPWPFSAASSSSSSIFPSCRKHSRDEEDGGKQNQDACILVPKTLRTDDPEAAAKSSIWTMVGIKSSKNTTVSGGGLLKAFQPRVDVRNHAMETPLLLHANPAALSRSLNFQESS